MQIDPVAKQYKEIARANFLKIPPFQRPYSWTPDNTEEFWIDIVNAQGKEYFLGSVVFYHDTKDKTSLFITDGQQRITTINIALCALRDICAELELDDLATGMHSFIEKVDEDNKKRFAVRYAPTNKFFAESVLSKHPSDREPETEEEKNQKTAYDYFRKKIVEHLTELVGDEWASNNKTQNHIKVLRDSIINTRFVVLTLDNEDEAFVIFETLNTRGKDLEVSDLVKNHFAKYVKDENKDIDTVSATWTKIRNEFENAEAQIDFDTFLVHYWLSEEKYVSKKRLFKEFKKAVPRAKARRRLKDVAAAAKSYAHIASPQDYWPSSEQLKIRRSLRAVNVFAVAQARPLLLAICRKHRETKTVSLKAAARTIQLIENFTFQFNAVTQSRGGGGIAAMYASLAQGVSKVANAQEFADCEKEIKRRFHERDLSQDEFDLGWDSLRFNRENTRDRQLVRYILQKFRMHFSPNAAENFDEFTIEHIVSQSNATSAEELNEVGRMGNLIFVPDIVNGKLGSKPSKEKLKILNNEGFTDQWLEQDETFEIADISGRSASMATVAFEEIWKY